MTDLNGRNGAGAEPIDASFELLSHPWRRSLIQYVIRTQTEMVSQGELATVLLDQTDDAIDRESVTTELCHIHLPKMDELGVIEYEPTEERARVDLDLLTTHTKLLQSAITDLQTEPES